jgi:hypothetical protein
MADNENTADNRDLPPPATASNLQPFITQMWTHPIPRRINPRDFIGTGSSWVPGPMSSQPTEVPAESQTAAISGVSGVAGEIRVTTADGAAAGIGEARGIGASIAEATGATTNSAAQVGVTAEPLTAQVTVDAKVIRAPFSEAGIAERLAENPEFYRQLLHFAANNLRNEASNYKVEVGKANSAAVVRAELHALADRFEGAAEVLEGKSPDRFATAANLVSQIRSQVAGFADNHPELANGFFDLAAVVLGCYALHQIGASGDVAAFVSYAVIKREKLSEIIKAWRGGKDEKKK